MYKKKLLAAIEAGKIKAEFVEFALHSLKILLQNPLTIIPVLVLLHRLSMALKLLSIGMRIENTVMLIDDDPDDLEILQDAISAIDGGHKIVTANNGVEGLQKLNELSASGSLPCLIVLDLNMPKLDGKQTFVAIKADKQLSKLPVVIFSTSSSMLDKTFFDRYDVAYFVKPVNFRQFVETASRLINYCSHNI